MDDLINPIWFFNGTIMMWIAVSIAAIFILAVAYDIYLRRRKRSRKGSSGRSRRSDSYSPGIFRRLRLTYEAFGKEAARRRRHIQRNREREEVLRGRR
jgi:hypothetical protein